MKHLLMMIVLTGIGTVGAFQYQFLGVLIYYLYAVLRPQFLWKWALPDGISWSLYVALATILSFVLGGSGRAVHDRPEERAGRSTSRMWIVAFSLWIALTYFTAHNRDYAYRFFEEYVKIFIMMFVAMVVIRSVREVWMLMVMAALVLGYIANEINILYLQTGYILVYRRGYGGLDNNGAGLMLAMGVPLCFSAWDTMRSRWRWFFLLLVPWTIHAVLMSYSRGAMLSILLASPLMFLRARRKGQAGLFALVLGFVAVPIMAGDQIRDRFVTISDHEVDESANSRKQSWMAAYKMALDNPITGVGVRNANLFSFQYGADMEGRTIHSQYLQIAADNGFVGLGLYLGMLGTGWLDLARARRCCRRRGDLDARRLYGVAAGVECSMAVFCIGAIFLSLENFELPFMLLVICSRAGAIARSEAFQSRSAIDDRDGDDFNGEGVDEFDAHPRVKRG